MVSFIFVALLMFFAFRSSGVSYYFIWDDPLYYTF